MRLDEIRLFGTGTGTGTAPSASLATTASFAQPSMGAWISGGSISITSTGAAPAKGSMYTDRVSYRQLGPKLWEVWYQISTNTAGSNGSGDYLIGLPAGISFDTSVVNQTVQTGGSTTPYYALGSGYTKLNTGDYQVGAYGMVYNSGYFRVAQWLQGYLDTFWSATQGGMKANAPLNLSFTFIST